MMGDRNVQGVLEVISNTVEAHPNNKELLDAAAGALAYLSGQSDVNLALR